MKIEKKYINNETHWLPDILCIYFKKQCYTFTMPWARRFFSQEYEVNEQKTHKLHLKDFSNYHSRLFKYEGTIKHNNILIPCKYYREILVYKYKLFGKWINKNPKIIYKLLIEFNNSIEEYLSFKEENCQEAFNRYCEEKTKEVL